jgi:hypothetical protein
VGQKLRSSVERAMEGSDNKEALTTQQRKAILSALCDLRTISIGQQPTARTPLRKMFLSRIEFVTSIPDIEDKVGITLSEKAFKMLKERKLFPLKGRSGKASDVLDSFGFVVAETKVLAQEKIHACAVAVLGIEDPLDLDLEDDLVGQRGADPNMLREITDAIEKSLNVYFSPESLEQLQRRGRVFSVERLVATVLPQMLDSDYKAAA